MPLAGEWGPGGSVLYMFHRVKGRKKKRRRMLGKKNTTNPKQNADGSCADSPLSALWRALLYFMWVSSLVLILLSLPSYLSISHSLASSISWLIKQPLFQQWLALLLLIFHSNDFFDHFHCRTHATQQLCKEGAAEEEATRRKTHKHEVGVY